MTKRNSLYLFALLAIGAGIVWIGWNYNHHSDTNLCLFKAVTGFPCPSCGITRSMLSLYHWNLRDAIWHNPLGIIMGLALCILPLWMLYDIIKKRSSFYNFYCRLETALRNKQLAIPLIALVVINWVWNIYKYHL